MSKIPYNTALKGSLFENHNHYDDELYFKSSRGIIACFDISQFIPACVNNTEIDCIYSEIAWEHGYNIFFEKAGKQQTTSYSEYIDGISKIINKRSIPVYITCSKNTAKKLNAEETFNIIQNGKIVTLAVFHNKLDLSNCKTNDDVIDLLSQNYNCVFDFSCGYGNALKKFKRFVGLDINTQCLGYIKKEIMQ